MRLKLSHLEGLAFFGLYAIALYVWLLPLSGNQLPFGDVDASSHFAIGDYMAAHDTGILKVPYYLFERYGNQNDVASGYLWYAPQYWTITGIAQILGGMRIFPVFIFIAISGTLIIGSLYFFMRKLFGFWPALIAGLLTAFSTRDYMIYLWGQWPQSLSFAFTPLIMYCFYQYVSHFSQSTPQLQPSPPPKKYLYIMALFLSAQMFFHPQGLVASGATLLFATLFLWIKHRKFPVTLPDVGVSLLIFLIISFAFAPLNTSEFFVELVKREPSQSQMSPQFHRLFTWYHIRNDEGIPDFYFTYKNSHGSLDEKLQDSWMLYWTLPFLLLGIFIVGLRRKEHDIMLLSWLSALYVLTRLTTFGIGGGRDIRMFAFEGHVFYSFIAIGVMAVPSFFKNISLKIPLKYGLIAVVIFFGITVNAQSAYMVLSGMQHSIGRINPAQYEAAEWIRQNIPQDADIYDVGTLGYQNYAAKIKWMGVLSQRHFIVNDGQENTTDYVVVDYSDAKLLRNQQYIDAISAMERPFGNSTPVYNRQDIKVYHVAAIKQ